MKSNDIVKTQCESDAAPKDASRRKAVKTIVGGVTAVVAYTVFPVQWNKPIVEQIFLPAHGATSGEVNEPEPEPEVCGELAAGCYLIEGPALAGMYVSWPGGVGPSLVPVMTSATCSDFSYPSYEMVVAADLAEAEEIFQSAALQVNVSELQGGCSLYLRLIGG